MFQVIEKYKKYISDLHNRVKIKMLMFLSEIRLPNKFRINKTSQFMKISIRTKTAKSSATTKNYFNIFNVKVFIADRFKRQEKMKLLSFTAGSTIRKHSICEINISVGQWPARV